VSTPGDAVIEPQGDRGQGAEPRPRPPARDLGDIRLADLVAAAGCPICAARDEATSRFIDAILWESVNDVEFRRELDAARGFCEAHSRALLNADRAQSGGSLGAAILYHAILAIRTSELAVAMGTSGRTRRRRAEAAAAPAACPVCRIGRDAEAGTIRRLRQLSGDPPWAHVLATADVCLAHIAALLRDGPATNQWRDLERRQLDRLRSIVTRLEGFVFHSGHDRRDQMTDAERRAVEEAASLLGGGG
jgi:hypothetical protein